jgi:hypothetical protein
VRCAGPGHSGRHLDCSWRASRYQTIYYPAEANIGTGQTRRLEKVRSLWHAIVPCVQVSVDRAPARRPTRQISIQVGAPPGSLPLNNVRLSYAFLPYNGSFFNLTSVVTAADR